VAKILKKYRIRRITAAQVLKILRVKPLTVAPGTTEAMVMGAQIVVTHLRILHEQRKELRAQLEETAQQFHGSAQGGTPESGKAPKPRDAAILSSMPGVGLIVLATLIAEGNDPLQRRDYRALRCLCGVAPVTRQSGGSKRVVQRKAANHRLVNALYHWARVAVQRDPTCRAKYDALRRRGHGHARALRSVGDRLLAVACAMLRSGTLFDPKLARSQSS